LRAWPQRRSTRPYTPGNRGLWRKAKALNRQKFVVVGWSDPEGSRRYLGALLLGYYTDDGKLIYAGRFGTGMPGRLRWTKNVARIVLGREPATTSRELRTDRIGRPDSGTVLA
jgi:ATP-dependent DNA ligase